MHRQMNYKDPQELQEDLIDYIKDTKDNPRIKVEYVGRDGERVHTPLERPLTIEGFKNFVYNKRGFAIHDYMYSDDDRYKPFSNIVTRAKEIIRQDQIEGGLLGAYNSNLTARINGLKEQNSHEFTEQPIFGNESKS